MTRKGHPTSDQPMLPLSLDAPSLIGDPTSDTALRAAYTRAQLWPRHTFEDAMADKAMAMAIRISAEAAAKKIRR